MKKVKEYKKLNSFDKLNIKNQKDNLTIINKINNILNNKTYFENLSTEQIKVLDIVKKDLLIKEHVDLNRFKLSKHVVEEIKSIDENKIPLYLFHRYRYEMFPELKILDEFPPYLQIEPSSICNYRCVFCFETDKSFTNKKNGYMGTMKLDLFKKVIDQAENNIEFLSIASRGEPLVSKEIIPMLRYIEGKFLNLKLNTNASLLNEEIIHALLGGGVKTLVFSADAADEKLYAKLRVNGNLKKVLDNIELFNKIKISNYPKSKIITRVSGVKVNDNQDIEAMNKLWGDLVDQVAFVNYNPWENVYLNKENKISKPCSDLWRRMFVWWDGKVNPCDTDYKSNLSVGNFTGDNNEISKIWISNSYQLLRQAHLAGNRKKIKPCNSCVVT